MPKIVSASPVATWLADRLSVSTAKIIAAAAPHAAATTTASHGLPVMSTVAKAAIAPISIMPSTPRLSTPLFSVTSSPKPAKRIGVEAPTTVMMTAMR